MAASPARFVLRRCNIPKIVVEPKPEVGSVMIGTIVWSLMSAPDVGRPCFISRLDAYKIACLEQEEIKPHVRTWD